MILMLIFLSSSVFSLFEKKDHDVQSSMTGDYVINYKMSKGGG